MRPYQEFQQAWSLTLKVRKLLLVYGIYAVLALRASSWAFANGLNDDGLYANKDWTLEFTAGSEDLIIVATHGTDVWGHQFGFFVRWPKCDSKNLFVSLSTYGHVEENAEGISFTFEFLVENRGFLSDVTLVSVTRFTPLLTVAMFANGVLSPELYSALKRGRDVSVEMKAPTRMLEFFDIRKDEFSLDGFSEVAEVAEKTCLAGRPNE